MLDSLYANNQPIKMSGEGPIVVVDDDKVSLRIAKAVYGISKISRPLVLLESGKALLEYLEKVLTHEAEMPSVVLLDINMPEPNGHETLERIRTQQAFETLPVIVMFTASNDDADMQRALDAGANGYQVKPFAVEDFKNFLCALLPE